MPVIRTDCPHCHTQRVAFELKWEFRRPHDYLTLGLCGSCGLPVTALLEPYYGADAPLRIAFDVEEYYNIREMWPKVEPIGAPKHTPPPVAKRFTEGEQAYSRENWISAVAMYRSALDIATKSMEGVPPGLKLVKRLQWLHDNHRITPDMKDWADHVRVEGNDALHDPEDVDAADARSLRLFTETFLKYVYELPGEVSEFRSTPNSDIPF